MNKLSGNSPEVTEILLSILFLFLLLFFLRGVSFANPHDSVVCGDCLSFPAIPSTALRSEYSFKFQKWNFQQYALFHDPVVTFTDTTSTILVFIRLFSTLNPYFMHFSITSSTLGSLLAARNRGGYAYTLSGMACSLCSSVTRFSPISFNILSASVMIASLQSSFSGISSRHFSTFSISPKSL